MIRAIVGIIKGLVVGGGIGYGLFASGLGGGNGVITYLACGLVGALVGVVCGRPPWKSETIWTPVVKALFGALIAVGLCFAGMRFLPQANLLSLPQLTLGTHDATFLTTVIGILYGAFVEIDDGGAAPAKDEKKQQKPAAKA